ncbi:MAG: putative bifunctional diguanylate cyclase/phosphodiesterase [Chloroflexota bacterium]
MRQTNERRWWQFGLLGQLLAAFSTVCAVLAVVGFIGIATALSIKAGLDEVGKHQVPSTVRLGATRQALIAAQRDLLNALLTDDNLQAANLLAQVRLDLSDSRSNFATFVDNAGADDQEQQLIQQYLDASRAWEDVVQSGLAEASVLADSNARSFETQAGKKAATTLVMTGGAPRYAAQIDALDELVALRQWRVNEAEAEADATYEKASRILVLAVVGGVAFAFVIGLFVARGITRSVRRVIDAMSSGDLQRRTGIDRHDEIGELGREFDHMADRLEASMAEAQSMAGQLRQQAFHDALTGLGNRALLMQRVEQALHRSSQAGGWVGLLFIDLDRFKVINDSLGHAAGDQLLIEVSQRLLGCLRPGDTVARLGGDEFTVLLDPLHRASEAIAVADRILSALKRPIPLDGRQTYASASIGIACAEGAHTNPAELLRDADIALYRAKAAGKGRYAVFDAQLETTALQQLDSETALRGALERGEFRVHYQPIVALKTGAVVNLEALVRWCHPERGLVPPGDFIPLAEETGLIVPIGQWVLEEACRRVSTWQREFGPQLGLSVNLSGRQFQHPELVDDIRRALSSAGLPPRALTLEITESVVMRDPEAAVGTLLTLHDLGIRLAVDDFGTGYSSLSYLKRFAVDTLKIDRSFVDGLGKDGTDTAIVRSIIALGQALGMTIIAEGIETPAQRAHLMRMRCEHGQGFLFARPLESEQLVQLLESEGGAWPRAA